MSTLSELVKFKNNLLELITDLSLDNAINEKIHLFDSLRLRNESIDYNQLIQQHVSDYQNLIVHSNDIITRINHSINVIDNDIAQLASTVDNSKFTEENMCFLSPTTDEIEKILQSKISASGDWHFPGLQLCRYISDDHWQFSAKLQEFANAKTRMDYMIACDPLYIVGQNFSILEKIIEPFPDAYQRRLRLYEIKNRNYSELPHDQFGLILCWDYFNYLPIDTIEQYLGSIIKLLRPGGKLVFSYTNGEIVSSAKLVEEHKAPWATATLLTDMITNLGYEFIVAENFPTNDMFDSWISWMEIKKPGELTTVKRAQAVGAVLAK